MAKPTEAAGGCKPWDRSRPAGLSVVATPIGNAQDLTLRALSLLGTVDLVLCEDTRVTGKLLKRHGIEARLFAYHEHNARAIRPALIQRLKGGETMALVSDAGTPLVSDPGYRLVREASAQGVSVTALPGPSAVVNALVLSGLPADRFFFEGFLPNRRGARRKALAALSAIPATLVILESAKRFPGALADMAAVLGDRDAVVVREMTKLFEEVRPGTLASLSRHYADAGPPKGEIVVVVGGSPGKAPIADADLDALLVAALDRLSVRDAAARVAEKTGLARKRVYERALAIKKSRS